FDHRLPANSSSGQKPVAGYEDALPAEFPDSEHAATSQCSSRARSINPGDARRLPGEDGRVCRLSYAAGERAADAGNEFRGRIFDTRAERRCCVGEYYSGRVGHWLVQRRDIYAGATYGQGWCPAAAFVDAVVLLRQDKRRRS